MQTDALHGGCIFRGRAARRETDIFQGWAEHVLVERGRVDRLGVHRRDRQPTTTTRPAKGTVGPQRRWRLVANDVRAHSKTPPAETEGACVMRCYQTPFDQ
jgi:hypothetical protein